MAVKRKLDDIGTVAPKSAAPSKKPKKGFSVGPANLPDGTYRRKGNDDCTLRSTSVWLIPTSQEDQG